MNLQDKLRTFCDTHKFNQKGPLSVALVVTEHARKLGLPLDADDLLTARGGQVKGLGGGSVQNILKRHGISRVLAREGGRTSRGSIDNMRAYVDFLNELTSGDSSSLDNVEKFWITEVLAYFSRHPFKLSLDSTLSITALVDNLLRQAEERSKESPGTYYQGAVLQHLVGAKLNTVLPDEPIEHHSFSTSDSQTGRAGDFFVGNVAIHVTTSPGEAVIDRCEQNLTQGLRPLIVTIRAKSPVAEGLAQNRNLENRIDIFDIQQFLAANLYEQGRFRPDGHRPAIGTLFENYNSIIEQVETDLSLKVELA